MSKLKKYMDKIFYRQLNSFHPVMYWIKRPLIWYYEKAMPVLSNIIIFLIVLHIIMKLYDNIGFEKTILTEVALGIFLLRIYLKSFKKES